MHKKTATSLHLTAVLKTTKMENKHKTIPSHFDGEIWQTYFDLTQEPVLITLSELSNEYVKVKAEYDSAPTEKKKYCYARLKRLEKIICAIDESHKAGRDYVGSLVSSFYVEYKRLEALKNRELDEMHESYNVISDAVLKHYERKISSPLKKVA